MGFFSTTARKNLPRSATSRVFPRKARGPAGPGVERTGFTLIELALVAGLIALVLAIAMPRLLPVFAFSQLESAARHVGNYGRGAAAYCAFRQQRITVRVDLAQNEYWAVRRREAVEGALGGDTPKPEDDRREEATAAQALELLAQGDSEALAEQALQMQEQLDLVFRRALEARARNVPRESLLAEVNPLEGHDFKLDDDEEQDFEEIKTAVLERTKLPPGVVIESVRVGRTSHVKGTVEIEITPMGLTDSIVFCLRGEDGDYFTVRWDPITAGAQLERGKQAAL